MPGLRHLAIVGNANAPGAVREMGVVQASARTLGLEVATSEIRRAEDFAAVFEALTGRVDALYVCTDGLITTNSIRFNNLAMAARLPTTYVFREDVAAGGLMSYGPNFSDVYRRAADYVDKILRGAKPADIPIEQPTKFDLVINLNTAKALGLTVSPSFLARADEVIEYRDDFAVLAHSCPEPKRRHVRSWRKETSARNEGPCFYSDWSEVELRAFSGNF